MKLGILFSGGKDSYLSMQMAAENHQISCLLTINSLNQDSWMFHTPAIRWTKLQSESLGIPQIIQKTKGIQDEELEDLSQLINNAKKKYSIHGIVTGALASTYQSTRIQKICNDLGLWCFNPLWQLSQEKLLQNPLWHVHNGKIPNEKIIMSFSMLLNLVEASNANKKELLWKLLSVKENIGISLTESYAMYPTASVSGWYFSHPDSRYFGLGKINRDQVQDYAERKNQDLENMEKWLSPNLGYDPKK